MAFYMELLPSMVGRVGESKTLFDLQKAAVSLKHVGQHKAILPPTLGQ